MDTSLSFLVLSLKKEKTRNEPGDAVTFRAAIWKRLIQHRSYNKLQARAIGTRVPVEALAGLPEEKVKKTEKQAP